MRFDYDVAGIIEFNPLMDKITLEEKEEEILKLFRNLDINYTLVPYEDVTHIYPDNFYTIPIYGVRLYKYLSYPKLNNYSFIFLIQVVDWDIKRLMDMYSVNPKLTAFYNFERMIDTDNIETNSTVKLRFNCGVCCTEFKNPELLTYLAKFEFEDLNNKDINTNTINPYK